ncbi:hypothetical protein SDC9_151643 [bioreactor metagenome]|uniref:Uncharacterized protein n=1 Tax=bioreactor metagenome TaxID=1076179 RepID=A0A645EQU8_9ZZZZ
MDLSVFDRDFNNIEVKNAFERVIQFLSKYIG